MSKNDKPIKRPYATMYYSGTSGREPALISQGFAATDRGAIRASVVRIFMGEYNKAVIYDRVQEVPIYTVKIGAHGLQVHYGLATESRAKLHRVK